jgi:hypothetical protein
MTYIKINDSLFPATIRGFIKDKEWNDRESKAITLEMSYADAMATFVDDLKWSIVYTEGENTMEYDNSEFCLAGSVTDNRNGTVTVKMGKITDADILAVIMGG